MSANLMNKIQLLNIEASNCTKSKSPDPIKSNESNEPIGDCVDPHIIQQFVSKGVNVKSKRSHYTIGDSKDFMSCGPVLQIIPKGTEVIVRQEKTKFVSEPNVFDGKHIIEDKELGIKIGTNHRDKDFLLILGKNGCVVVESTAFVNLEFDSTKDSIFIIKSDGQYSRITGEKQIVFLFEGGHVMLLGSQTLIIVGESGFDEDMLTTDGFRNIEKLKSGEIEEQKVLVGPEERKIETKSEAKDKPILRNKEKTTETPKDTNIGEIDSSERFKGMVPNDTYTEMVKLSEYKFYKMVTTSSHNPWYFKGRFRDQKLLCKVYNKQLLAPLHQIHYLRAELNFVKELFEGKLRNNNLVEITKVIETKSTIFIFMANYKMSALKLMMQKGVQGEGRAKTITLTILNALEYLHSNGIAHRNIKLENIYLNLKEKFVAKLADFTCAMIFKSDNEIMYDNSWVGSEEYMSREILEREPHDPRIPDMWALGVCLFVLIYNCFPFGSGSGIRTEEGRDIRLNKMLGREYSAPQSSKVSKHCTQMWQQLLTPNAGRVHAKQALMHPWFTEHTV